MSPITPSPIWRGSMQSPDNFAIMNGLCDRQERGAAQNLRLSTLTFECNHESHACGTHIQRDEERRYCRRMYVCMYEEKCCVARQFVPDMCGILFSRFKENSDLFDDRGNGMYVTRKHGRRGPLLSAIKVIPSSRPSYSRNARI